jgi:hypothetical protein
MFAGELDVFALSHQRLFTNLPVMVELVDRAGLRDCSLLLTFAGEQEGGG